MDNLIAEAERVPQRGEYKLADFLKGYREALMLKRTDNGYNIVPTDGWEPSPYSVERNYLIPYKKDLVEILRRL